MAEYDDQDFFNFLISAEDYPLASGSDNPDHTIDNPSQELPEQPLNAPDWTLDDLEAWQPEFVTKERFDALEASFQKLSLE